MYNMDELCTSFSPINDGTDSGAAVHCGLCKYLLQYFPAEEGATGNLPALHHIIGHSSPVLTLWVHVDQEHDPDEV